MNAHPHDPAHVDPAHVDPAHVDPAGLDHLDRVVALGATGRYHGALRRLASLSDAALASGARELDALHRAVAEAIERSAAAGGDHHHLRHLRSLTARHFGAAHRRLSRQLLRPTVAADATRSGAHAHQPAPPLLRRRVPARRAAATATLTVDA